ncbi:MAG: histidinol-phosphate transaminase [Anaerolineales bacterium]
MNPFQPQDLLRDHIRDMPPYQPIHPFDVLSERLGFPEDALIKLDANENPYGPLPQVQETLRDLPYIHIYPDPESRYLRQDLSQFHGIPLERILAGAGADELIDLILRAILDPGDLILDCPPTFSMYAFDADVNAARTLNVPRKDDFSLDLPGVKEAVHAYRPKALFLASPNNPDGGLLSPKALETLLDLPLLIVVDEAYIHFAPPGSSVIDLTPQHENLIVLRTFSKWGGLAGLRVGYGIFPDWITPAIWKIKQPYNINAAASAAARTTLQFHDQLSQQSQAIIRERDRLFEALQGLPWLSPYPSQANFILCRVKGRDALEIKESLAQEGILIRYFNKPRLDDHIRISVGKPEHTAALMQTLRRM